MHALAFIIAGTLGLLLLFFSGNRLLHSPNVSSRRFAYLLSGSFTILLFTLILISRQIDMGLIVLALLLSSINFGLSYLVVCQK